MEKLNEIISFIIKMIQYDNNLAYQPYEAMSASILEIALSML